MQVGRNTAAFLLILVTLLGGLCPWAQASLEGMERTASKASSLSEFLRSKQLIDEYYREAVDFFGGEERFPRKSFNAIVKQMKDLARKSPEFAQRAWETGNMGQEFEIRTTLKTHGVDLNSKAWSEFIQEKQAEAYGRAKGLYAISSPEARVNRVIEALRTTADQIREFEARLPAKRAERASQSALFYANLRNDSALNEALNYLLHEYLQSEAIEDIFRTGDPDLILEVFKNLKEHPSLLAKSLEEKSDQVPPRAISLGKNLIPSLEELLSPERHLFPVRMRATRNGMVPAGRSRETVFKFIPSPRVLHTFMKGIPLKECVGGACGAFLKSLSPERWASGAIQGTQFHFAQEQDSYLGFIQATPGTIQDQTYGSLDLGMPTLQNKVLISEPGSTIPKAATLFDLVIEKSLGQIPSGWKGLLFRPANGMDNAGVLNTVLESFAYILGRPIGKSEDFRLEDPLVNDIINARRRKGHAKTYGGRMILGATIPEGGNLHQLSSVPKNLLSDDEVLWAKLQSLKPETQKQLLSALSKHSPFSNFFYGKIASLILDPKQDSGVKGQAAELLMDAAESKPTPTLIGLLKQVHSGSEGPLRSKLAYATLKADPSAAGFVADLSESLHIDRFSFLIQISDKNPEAKAAVVSLSQRLGIREVYSLLQAIRMTPRVPEYLAPRLKELLHLILKGQVNPSADPEQYHVFHRAIGLEQTLVSEAVSAIGPHAPGDADFRDFLIQALEARTPSHQLDSTFATALRFLRECEPATPRMIQIYEQWLNHPKAGSKESHEAALALLKARKPSPKALNHALKEFREKESIAPDFENLKVLRPYAKMHPEVAHAIIGKLGNHLDTEHELAYEILLEARPQDAKSHYLLGLAMKSEKESERRLAGALAVKLGISPKALRGTVLNHCDRMYSIILKEAKKLGRDLIPF